MDGTYLHIATSHLNKEFFYNEDSANSFDEAFPNKETPDGIRNASIIIDFTNEEVKLDSAGPGGGVYKIRDEHRQNNWPDLKGTFRCTLGKLLPENKNLADLEDPILLITDNIHLVSEDNCYDPGISLKIYDYVGDFKQNLDEIQRVNYSMGVNDDAK